MLTEGGYAMSKIVLLANSDDMFDVAQAAIHHTASDVQIAMTRTYDESINLARKYAEDGYRMIIARGAHARIVRESGISVPVTSIPFTGNNIIPVLAQATKDWGEFAVAGNPTMIQMTRELERSLEAKVHYFEVHVWEDFEKVIREARDLGLNAIVGGYDVCRTARAHGLHDYCIKTSEYEVVTAIKDAQNLLVSLERDRHWDSVLRAALDTFGDGVVITDPDYNVVFFNRRAKKLLGRDDSFRKIENRDVLAMSAKAKETGRPVYDEVIEHDGIKLSVSCVPMMDGENLVFNIQEVEYVHKIERNIRQKLSNKGLVAKKNFEDITAVSDLAKETVRKARLFAETESSILISGESGTGKEMYAQSIHNASKRADQAFVAVNCATIPANLLESELFGYAEGAFTGAKRGGKVGLFELAHNGTIFLDEIGETSLDMQARLLRVLEEHEIMRVGDDKVIPVDIRVIAASNRDLRKLIEEGKFRQDFYYRLNVLSLQLPPLREERENIPELIDIYTEKYTRRNNRHMIEYDDESREMLYSYDWPGNVRELKNVVERLVVMNDSGKIDALQVRDALQLNGRIVVRAEKVKEKNENDRTLLNEHEALLIKKVLEECRGNKTETAAKLGISRPTLNKKLKMIEEAEKKK